MYLIYSTTETLDQAKELVRPLIEAKWVACANIYPSMTSIYAWEGKMQEATEMGIILKVSDEKLEKAMELLKTSHPYTCPAIVAVKADKVDGDFAKWIDMA